MKKATRNIVVIFGVLTACVVAVTAAYFLLIYPDTYGDVSNNERVIGESDTFTEQEINAAMDVVEEEFVTWGGCKMISLRYDEEAIPPTELSERKNEFNSEKVIILYSDFSTSKTVGGGFNRDFTYTNYRWVLVGSEDGSWTLMTNGYA